MLFLNIRRSTIRLVAVIIALVGMTGQANALTCSEVRQLTMLYFKMHFSHSKFDDEISRRTLENFVEDWDPSKMYFYESDIAEFRKAYSSKIDDLIYGNMDCSVINEIMNRYTKRFEERQSYAIKLVDTKHDFTIDEYMNVDRDTMGYAKNQKEIEERWRQRVKFQLLTLKTSLDNDLKKAQSKLKKRYNLSKKRQSELTKDKVFGVFLNSFSRALDPHSTYLPADELEDFRIRTRLSLEGIGATLRSEDGFTIVVSLVKGGAAHSGGLLKVNDKIVAVAQGDGDPVDVIDMDLQEVVKKIRGARGTVVKLTVIRENSKKSKKLVVPIVREKIQLVEQQASSKVVEVELPSKKGKSKLKKIGVLTLPSFYIDFEGRQKRLSNFRSSSNDTMREIRKLQKQKIDALVVDLRNNGGGSLDESVKMAGLFFDKGPVVQIKAQNGDTESLNDEDGKTFYDGPLLVMINRHSASASEIFAGAIQDYGRGIIVGDSHTYGKGTVQHLNDIAPHLGAVKVTVNQFYRASGLSTQLNGVDADIVLPSLVDRLEIGEKYYDYALPFEKIKADKHQEFGAVKPYIKELASRSELRRKKDENFSEIEKEIKDFEKNKAERMRVSLKLNKDGEDDEDEEKAAQDSADGEDGSIKLSDDIYLQETVRIAAEYAALKNGQKLTSAPSIPELKKAKKAKAVAEKEKVKETKERVKVNK